jgi:hypothetical protein
MERTKVCCRFVVVHYVCFITNDSNRMLVLQSAIRERLLPQLERELKEELLGHARAAVLDEVR